MTRRAQKVECEIGPLHVLRAINQLKETMLVHSAWLARLSLQLGWPYGGSLSLRGANRNMLHCVTP
jgi:hypothetical protein